MTDVDTMERSAVISDCGTWRYRLDRRWADGPSALFVMLNPSTADGTEDDPTIRRCVGFARREGCGSLTVVNQFAYRATSPDELMRVSVERRRGPGNRASWDMALAEEPELIVAAWGNWFHAGTKRGGPWRFEPCLNVQALGVTRIGDPCHPLYLAADAKLRPWPPKVTVDR